MDDPSCDPMRLERTYAQFRVVNRLVAGWRTVYRRRLRPLLSAERPTTLLDVGFGGGDVPRAFARWARRDGLSLQVTAIDPDPRALSYAAGRGEAPGLRFHRATSAELVAAGERFDIVTSNHVLHHLTPTELAGLLGDSELLADRLVVHNDLARSALALASFGIVTWPLSRRSFIHHDGTLSIRRSYRPEELGALLPPRWTVERLHRYRILLVHRPQRVGPAPTLAGPHGA